MGKAYLISKICFRYHGYDGILCLYVNLLRHAGSRAEFHVPPDNTEIRLFFVGNL